MGGAPAAKGPPIFFWKKSDAFLVIVSETDDRFQLSSPHHSHVPTQGRINHCAGCTMGGPSRQGAPSQLLNF